MLKCVTAFSAAVIAASAFVGSTADADAGSRRNGCCGPIPPAFTQKTRTVHKHVVRYRDVWRNRYVPRVQPIVHVTTVQPIVHVHRVTRVHTRIVGVVRPVHHHVVQWLPPRQHVISSAVYLRPQCGCAY
jgi:hypothetical protein